MTTLKHLIANICDRISDINEYMYGRYVETTSDDVSLYQVPAEDYRTPAYISLRTQCEPLCATRHSKWIAFILHDATAYIVRRVDCLAMIQEADPTVDRINLYLDCLIPVTRVDKSHGTTKALRDENIRLTTTVETLMEEVTQKTNELKRKHEEIITLSQHKEDDDTSLVIETRVCVECEKELPLSKFIVKSKSKKKDDTQQKEYTSYRKKCGSCRWVGCKKAKVSK